MGGPDSALRGAACPGFDTERDRGGGGGTMTLHFSVTGHSIIIVRSYDCASVRAPTSRVLHRRDTHARNHGARTTTIIVTNTTYSASAIKSTLNFDVYNLQAGWPVTMTTTAQLVWPMSTWAQ